MIREPRVSDIEGLVLLLRKMHAETAYSAFELSETRVRETLLEFLDQDRGFFGRVMVTSGEISGVFFGHASQLWFSDELCGFDDLWYVAPGSRGSLLSARMVREFAVWSRERGCSAVLVGVSSGVMVDRTGLLLETLGFGRIGGLYRRHI